MNFDIAYLYIVPVIVALAFYVKRRKQRERISLARQAEAAAAGLTEPTTLHPVFDPGRCIGSGACVSACPEDAIAIIGGLATLVNGAACIGHGACLKACPTSAIKLVFGTERRGVDIPQVDPRFETNVPGIFIAGELGGMGLIHKAVEQGRQALQTISERKGNSELLDVVIVGAGPAGLAASLAAKEKRLRFVTLEQEASLGGTVYHFPRNKLAMTHPMNIPTAGKLKLGKVSKEALLELWTRVTGQAQLKINFRERVDEIKKAANGFVVSTPGKSYQTRSVLLAIGRRGTPRQLGVPGEEQAKVVYRLIDPAQYRGQRVLVVGGGDAAIEAALAVCAEPGTAVALSYRRASFNRIKTGNRDLLEAAATKGRVRVLMESEIVEIQPELVVLKHGENTFTLRNDAVIVCAGGLLPSQFLRDIGILVNTRHGAT